MKITQKNQKKAKFEDIKKYVKAAKQFAKKGPKGLENAKKYWMMQKDDFNILMTKCDLLFGPLCTIALNWMTMDE